MENLNKLLDVITKQSQFILELFNDKDIPDDIKAKHSKKYNQLMIDMSDALKK